ncbi:sugar 3,4-ketoisomerase [Siansivirga zeaxanthinifaciens]|uniref:WxcM domain-containing protein n=1 Tax=Siansivirga zeaxanthinifaciens CC-SAMT-1 TaxID=1454006 RepID=A0A0C5W5G8_9FLAO|nr:FdtA/QdtA family cupin domain-containing protein [Siansivirga zeaxanthinifaciens]AJR02388.1 WxcM domain-containing protein [Siansivirga zeaxanthinifaciens CC-SAMT-1]
MEISNSKIINIPGNEDVRGALSFVQKDILPFDVKRVYYIYNIPENVTRGGHAHIEQNEFLIALKGSFNVEICDVHGNKKLFTLNKPNEGLLIPKMIWRELTNFKADSICLVLASNIYIEEDYIRDYDGFMNFK